MSADQNPTPPPTKLTPAERLEKLRNLEFWPEFTDLGKIQLITHAGYPDNAVGRLGSSGLVGSWPRPNGLAAEPVPVNIPLGEPQVVIEFNNVDHECPSSGVPLSAFYSMNTGALKDAEDIFSSEFGGTAIDFHVAWPGYRIKRYRPWSFYNKHISVTRFDLGRMIAVWYHDAFKIVEDDKVVPREPGFYNIALHQGRNAKPDSLGVQLTQLHLVRLRGKVGAEWVADIDIV